MMKKTGLRKLNPEQYLGQHTEDIMYNFCKENNLSEEIAKETLNIIKLVIHQLHVLKQSKKKTQEYIREKLPKLANIQQACFEVQLTKALSADLEYRHAYNFLAMKQNREEGQELFPIIDENGNRLFNIEFTSTVNLYKGDRNISTKTEPTNMIKAFVVFFERDKYETKKEAIDRLSEQNHWKGSHNTISDTYNIASKIARNEISPSKRQINDLLTAITLLSGDKRIRAESVYKNYTVHNKQQPHHNPL